MINTTNSYKVSFVEKAKNGSGKTTFSIRDYDKEKPDERLYAQVYANNQIELKDGDMVHLDKLICFALFKKKDGGQGVRVFAEVSLAKPLDKPKEAHEPVVEQQSEPIIEATYEPVLDVSNEPTFDTGPLLDIDHDDLPF